MSDLLFPAPPMAAEKASPAEVTTENRPTTTCRRAYSTVSPMWTRVSGMTEPAKAPASRRTATNCQVLVHTAESAVHTLQPSAASRTTATRPWRSERGP